MPLFLLLVNVRQLMMTLSIIFRLGIPRDLIFHFSIKVMYIFLPIYFAHKSLFIIVVHCCLKKEILNMIASTFFSHNTKLQKYAYFQITVFTYYLQYISIVFSFALTFLPFLLYITLFLPCINSVGSISAKPQAYLMKLHSMCMP